MSKHVGKTLCCINEWKMLIPFNMNFLFQFIVRLFKEEGKKGQRYMYFYYQQIRSILIDKTESLVRGSVNLHLTFTGLQIFPAKLPFSTWSFHFST